MVETRRQQIEDAASTLFRERGYAATSVRDIARALDIQGASLYAHVASKEDVLWSIVERAAARFLGRARPIVGQDATPAERLRDLIHAHVEVLTEDLGHASVFLHEWRFLRPERRATVAQRRDEYEALFRAVIADGVAHGEFPDADPRLDTLAILSALNGIAGWYRPSGALGCDEIADHFAQLFVHALTSRSTARRSRR